MAPSPDEPAWRWAERSVDFALAPNYDTPFAGPYDADVVPFWKEPIEATQDINIREVSVVKCSRAGGSENLILNRIRHAIDVDPQPTLYLTSDQLTGERFMTSRVKRGLETSPACRRELKRARATEHDIRFPKMDFRMTWPNQKGAFKQDGWSLIFGDEVSTWPGFSADMLRKRGDSYPFHHIVFISSLDPTRRGDPESDPIYVLWADTDRREWYMPDPGGGQFRFELGTDTKHGLKWAPEARRDNDTWDLDMVRESAHYITPAGARIDNADREAVMRSGHWEPTREGARADRRGYRVNSFMVPFRSGDFGEVAAAFLSAKHRIGVDMAPKTERRAPPLRVFFCEYMAEVKREESIEVRDDTLADKEAEYERGNVYVNTGNYGVALTADVQKHHLWWVSRVWEKGENGQTRSALIDWGNCASMADFGQVMQDSEAQLVGVDIGYANRATDVADFCAEYTPEDAPRETCVYALRGSDTLKAVPMDLQIRDALEGRSRSGAAKFCELVWAVDVFRSWFMDVLRGDTTNPDWLVYRDVCADYIKQVCSTKRIDGEWIPPRHRQDHLFDCEVMQFVLARHDNIIR